MLAILPAALSFFSNPGHLKSAICVTGCSPYTLPPFPTWTSMVHQMADECALLIHVGDTKSGGGVCNDTLMADPLRIMRDTGVPTLYTLGDNEATDCHRMKSRADWSTGTMQPSGSYPKDAEYYTAEAARTHMINEFFTDLTTDVTGKKAVQTQSTECPFNVYTEVGSIAVATIEMPGSNFGLSNEANMDYVDPYSSHVSMFHRANNCNMLWLESSAAKAAAKGMPLIIGFHARWFHEGSCADDGTITRHSGGWGPGTTKNDEAYGDFLYAASPKDAPK